MTAKSTVPKKVGPYGCESIGQRISFHETDTGSVIILFSLHFGTFSVLNPSPETTMSPPKPLEGPDLGKAFAM